MFQRILLSIEGDEDLDQAIVWWRNCRLEMNCIRFPAAKQQIHKGRRQGMAR
jgi:hypothetical protein